MRKQGKETKTDRVRGESELPCASPPPQPRSSRCGHKPKQQENKRVTLGVELKHVALL